MTQQTKRPNLLPYLLVLLVLVGVYGFMNKPVEAEPSYAEVRELFESEQVSAFTVTDTTLRMKLREPIDGKTELKKDLFSVTLFYDDLGELIEQQKADGIIEGRNAVIEALRAGTTIDKIFIQKGETDKTLGHIASTARAAGVVVVDADKRKLDFMSRTHAHQGVIALTSVREYVSVEDILNIAREKGENPLIVVCDEISDPHNLGAIIRTAECAGAHGVVIPKRRSAGLTSIVAKTSAGAVSYVPVARVPNIPALLEQLQKEGVWVFGTAAEGTSNLYSADLKGPAAIVIGSEGDGMTRLVREKCDFLVSIPMKGKISSLNASAAAAILLYEAVRQRLGQ